jgi:hypothetical protein
MATLLNSVVLSMCFAISLFDMFCCSSAVLFIDAVFYFILALD